MVLDLRESMLDLLSEGKVMLVIDTRRRSPLPSTRAASWNRTGFSRISLSAV
jgi:hypothetical protein